MRLPRDTIAPAVVRRASRAARSPALANGLLYARDGGKVVCWKVKK